MKKWLITGLVVLALGVSVRWWLRFLPFFRTNSDLIQGLSGAIQIVLWLGAGLAFVIGLWRSRKKVQHPLDAVRAVQSADMGRDNIQATGNSRIGGVHIDAQGDVPVLGDLAGRDITKIIVQPEPPIEIGRASCRERV